MNMTDLVATSISTIEADGVDVFYRSAGSESAPVLLLLHGFPSSSHMFRNLLALLAVSYHVIAPDLPGFGFTEVPGSRRYDYTFASLARTLGAFLDALHIERFAMYIFDYGAPVGLRLALNRPEAVAAVVTQNGNAYTEGLGRDFWAPVERYWHGVGGRLGPERAALEAGGFGGFNATRAQYVGGSPHPARIQPEAYHLDQALLDRRGNRDLQLDMLWDYCTNIELYPAFQRWLRDSRVPVLAVWGRNDVVFTPPGAEAFSRDVDPARFELHFLDAGHFAVETNELEMAGLIDGFLKRQRVFPALP